jgi:hypothetical protein
MALFTRRKDEHQMRLPRRSRLAKIADFLLRTEIVWVSLAVLLVYISVFLGWGACSWVWLAIALLSFPLRLIKQGHLIPRTPFDIPLLILFIGIIVGLSLSEHFAISLGAFQTFLAMSALYYTIINYHHPANLMRGRGTITVLGLIIALALVFCALHSHLYHAGIGLAIIAAIALGIVIFSGSTIPRLVSALICSAFWGLAIYFAYHLGGLHRFFTLGTITSRMPVWQDALLSMQGSSIWIGLGLGCYHFISPGSYYHTHSIYLQLYTDTGVFGIVALIVAVVIGAKLAVDIIYSPRKHPYYGFGIGVLLAILFAALAGTVEIAPYAIPNWEEHWYVLSPIPWLLAAALVTARRLLKQPSTEAVANQGEQ